MPVRQTKVNGATPTYASFDKGEAAYDRGDYTNAYKEFKELAEHGHARAQCFLGWMYHEGQGAPQDHAEAVKWYRKAADQGHAKAQYNLATMYDEGLGVPQNHVEAVNWYRRAAEQGNADAQTLLRLRGELLAIEIPLEKLEGVYRLPVKINGVLTLKFILDTGAAEVNIPADVALTLLRTETITKSDFLPGRFYETVEGNISENSRFNIRELDIGGIKISQVSACVGSAKGSLLLGQSFLERLESWSLDNKRHVLIIGGGTVQPR